MSICRLCLNKNDVLPIFNDYGNENDISQKIFECIGIQISKDDVLPTAICSDCLGSINTWCLFIQKCHQIQTVLMDSYKEVPEERLDPSHGDILNVHFKTEAVSEDVNKEGDQMTDLMNDPNLDIPTNRCRICKCKYSSLSNLLRHTKTKMHQTKKKEIILDRSLLKQALVKKKPTKRRAQPFKLKKHICRTCQVTFSAAASLKKHCLSIKHLKILTAPKFIEQPKFEEQPKFLEQNNYEEELEEISEDEEFDDKDSCKKDSTLLEHLKPQTFSCKICNFKLANKEIHMNHIRIYHRTSSENQP